ncbi:MAG: SRPBCC domain-containing protein [Bryobacteraceae bacterium]
MTTTESGCSLQIKRTFAASPERVFRAWTDPAAMRIWFAPGDYTVPEAEAELGPGGRYRVQMRAPNGNLHEVTGTYKEVDPPRRLVFSWAWVSNPAVEMLVTVEFRASGEETEVTLTHERLPDEESRRRHEQGWIGCLAKLPAALA